MVTTIFEETLNNALKMEGRLISKDITQTIWHLSLSTWLWNLCCALKAPKLVNHDNEKFQNQSIKHLKFPPSVPCNFCCEILIHYQCRNRPLFTGMGV